MTAKSKMIEVGRTEVGIAKARHNAGTRKDECYADAKRNYVVAQRSVGAHDEQMYDQFIADLCEAIGY